MVICGAGASYDSANFAVSPGVAQYRPPMGAQLFADRPHIVGYIDRYADVRPLVHRFRSADSSESLEAQLEQIQTRSHDRQRSRKQMIALRYYLHRVIVHST